MQLCIQDLLPNKEFTHPGTAFGHKEPVGRSVQVVWSTDGGVRQPAFSLPETCIKSFRNNFFYETMATTNPPTLPTFSYAQAAKGQITSTSTSTATSTPQSSDLPASTPNHASAEKKPLSIERKLSSTEANVTGSGQNAQAAAGTTEQTDDVKRRASEEKVESAKAQSISEKKDTSPPNGQISKEAVENSAKRETSAQVSDSGQLPSTTTNGATEAWDKQSETSTVVDKTAQNTESGNDRPKEDEWAASSAPKPEPEFRAAPIPTVNVWQRRMEEANRKASSRISTTVNVNAPVRSRPQPPVSRPVETEPQDNMVKRKPSGKVGEKVDNQKKKADDVRNRDEGKHNFLGVKCKTDYTIGKRGSRQSRSMESEKEQGELTSIPPSVKDAMSWPTPDTAQNEEKKTGFSAEKADKIDTKTPGVKTGPKWVNIPFTPTPKFNTPLPPMSRRGGRAPRGGREGGRGGHIPQSSISEKSDKTKVMGPPPLPKQSNEQQRGRNQDSSAGDRAVSAPTQGRRSVSVGPSLSGQRKMGGASDRGQLEGGNRIADGSETPTDSTFVGYGETPLSARSRADSKSFSRQSSASYRGASYDNSKQHSGAETHSHPRNFSGGERRSAYGELERTGEAFGRRERGDSHKEGNKARDLESKNEAWRDRDVTGDRSETKNSRGRGNYRGRGGNHNGFNPSSGAPTHAFTAPLPQQPFPTGKPHGFADRHRQQSAPYSGGLSQQGSHRGAPRSQTIATHGIFPGMQNSFGPQLTPIQTEFPGMYNGYNPMFPGVMSPVPYSGGIEPNALFSMVTAQVEYYFSIENLCKDMYLRSNMDSQGWVPLRVIAGFNRIKSLTEDINVIRWVCQASRNIEFRPVEDGDDRVRKVDKWEQWVLEIEKRQPHAKQDAPPPLPRGPSPPQPNQMYPSMPQVVSPTWGHPMFDSYADAPTFTPTNFRAEDQIPPPTSGPLPDIPTGEHFSLTNGENEVGSSKAGSATGGDKSRTSPQPPATHNASRTPSQSEQPLRPSLGSAKNVTPTVNGASPSTPQEIAVENVFSNDRINELHICVRHSGPLQQQPVFLSPDGRTISQGSIEFQGQASPQPNTAATNLRGGSSGSPDA